MLSQLASHTSIAIAAVLGAFLALFGALQLCVRAFKIAPETTRKMFHTGSGTLTLAFPFLFHEMWPVVLLTAASGTLIAAVKFLPALRRPLGGVTNRVERVTLGELYFPLSIALLFWLARGSDPLLFVIPVLMLTFADATSALIGGRYGMTRYVGAGKSLEGSIAFVVVAFLCVHVPLLLWSEVGRAETLLISSTLALLVMLLEGSAWRGLDNLFIPIGGFFLLRAYLPLEASVLLPRLIVTIALVVLVVLVRQRTTLEDHSLVAGAFLCYVAWAVMGWPWLVGPLAITVGYRWLSPPTPDNSRRMHDMPAVLSVWAPAIAWLSLARTSAADAMLLPYTVAFGAHLAIFGISRLAFQFPAKPLAPLFIRAVVISWAIVMAPYVVATGTAPSNIAAAFASLLAIAAGAAVFVGSEPRIRDTPQTTRRWVFQAGAASLASAASWMAVVAAGAWISV